MATHYHKIKLVEAEVVAVAVKEGGRIEADLTEWL